MAIFGLAFIAVGASLGRLSSLVAWDNSGDITYDAATIPVRIVNESKLAIFHTHKHLILLLILHSQIWDAVETDVAIVASKLNSHICTYSRTCYI